MNSPQLEEGPVPVSVTYHVDRADAAAFLEEMRIAGEHKRRDGAMEWGIYRDIDDPEPFVDGLIHVDPAAIAGSGRPTASSATGCAVHSTADGAGI